MVRRQRILVLGYRLDLGGINYGYLNWRPQPALNVTLYVMYYDNRNYILKSIATKTKAIQDRSGGSIHTFIFSKHKVSASS